VEVEGEAGVGAAATTAKPRLSPPQVVQDEVAAAVAVGVGLAAATVTAAEVAVVVVVVARISTHLLERERGDRWPPHVRPVKRPYGRRRR
jgi:hypothetical protein